MTNHKIKQPPLPSVKKRLHFRCSAFLGHSPIHLKHKIHSVPFNRLRELSSTLTFIGHTCLHFPHWTHRTAIASNNSHMASGKQYFFNCNSPFDLMAILIVSMILSKKRIRTPINSAHRSHTNRNKWRRGYLFEQRFIDSAGEARIRAPGAA